MQNFSRIFILSYKLHWQNIDNVIGRSLKSRRKHFLNLFNKNVTDDIIFSHVLPMSPAVFFWTVWNRQLLIWSRTQWINEVLLQEFYVRNIERSYLVLNETHWTWRDQMQRHVKISWINSTIEKKMKSFSKRQE